MRISDTSSVASATSAPNAPPTKNCTAANTVGLLRTLELRDADMGVSEG